MLSTDAGKIRSLRYDAGMLFLWCWLLGFAYVFALGRPSPIEGLGSGLVIFLISALVLFGKRNSRTRLRASLLTAITLTGVIAWGSTQI